MIVGGSKGENSETRVNLNFIIYSNHKSKIKSVHFHYFSHTNLEGVEGGKSKAENPETRVDLNFIIYSNHKSKIKSVHFNYFSHTNLEGVE